MAYERDGGQVCVRAIDLRFLLDPVNGSIWLIIQTFFAGM